MGHFIGFRVTGKSLKNTEERGEEPSSGSPSFSTVIVDMGETLNFSPRLWSVSLASVHKQQQYSQLYLPIFLFFETGFHSEDQTWPGNHRCATSVVIKCVSHYLGNQGKDRSRFNSQLPFGSLQLSVTSVPGGPTPSSGFCRYCTHAGKTLMYIK